MGRRKTVLVTGIGGNTAQCVARSLLRFRDEFTIIGSDSDQYNVRFGLTYADRVYLIPRAETAGFRGAVSRIVDREEVDLIIPSPDAEVYAISKLRDELDAAVFLPDHSVVEVCQDKWLTYLALEGGVDQPKSMLIEDPGSLHRAVSEIGPPVWLRKRRGAGGSGSFIAQSGQEAQFWTEHHHGYGEFTASRFLQGRNLGWIGLYKDGELLTSGGYLRMRYFAPHVSPTGVTGTINVGMTIHDSAVNSVAERAVEAVDGRPHGAYTVDLKEDGPPYITEINAGRLHASAFVYTEAGLNLPYYYAKLALDEPVSLPAKRNAVKAGIVTIRNLDNTPLFISQDELQENILRA